MNETNNKSVSPDKYTQTYIKYFDLSANTLEHEALVNLEKIGAYECIGMQAKALLLAKPGYPKKRGLLYLLAKSYCQLGESDKLLDLVEYNISDDEMLPIWIPLVCSLPDFRKICYFWQKHLEYFYGKLGPGHQWLDFYQKHLYLFLNFLKDKKLEPKLSFSTQFPNFLSIMEEQELIKLIQSSCASRCHFLYCSWDLDKKLRVGLGVGYVQNGIPFWLRKQFMDIRTTIRIVFDACEEAPLVTNNDIVVFKKSMLIGDNVKCCVLTANQKGVGIFDDNHITTYNIYPLLIISSALNEVKALSTPFNFISAQHDHSLMVGVPRAHRLSLLLLLKRKGLLERTHYSWWGNDNKKAKELSNYIKIVSTKYPKLDFNKKEYDWLLSLPKKTVDTTGDNTHYMCSSISVDFFRSAKFHIVSETEYVHKNTFRLTEKTLKPILAGVPFLVLGVTGIVSYLRQCGFDILDDYIDHKYDEIETADSRMLALVSELERLKVIDIPNERLVQMHQRNIETVSSWFISERERYLNGLFGFLRGEKYE